MPLGDEGAEGVAVLDAGTLVASCGGHGDQEVKECTLAATTRPKHIRVLKSVLDAHAPPSAVDLRDRLTLPGHDARARIGQR